MLFVFRLTGTVRRVIFFKTGFKTNLPSVLWGMDLNHRRRPFSAHYRSTSTGSISTDELLKCRANSQNSVLDLKYDYYSYSSQYESDEFESHAKGIHVMISVISCSLLSLGVTIDQPSVELSFKLIYIIILPDRSIQMSIKVKLISYLSVVYVCIQSPDEVESHLDR